MNKMIAATTDERYSPGLAMIEENSNLTARVRALEKRTEFYRRMWELEQEENEHLREQLREVENELPREREAGAIEERRKHNRYLNIIYSRRMNAP